MPSTPGILIELDESRGKLIGRNPHTFETLIELSEEDMGCLKQIAADDHELRTSSLREIMEQLGLFQAPATLRAPKLAPPQSSGQEFATVDKKGRAKLWDLPRNLHCPVIGTCLDVSELRRLAIKARCEPANPLSDYDVHVSFVMAAEDKNALSLATHKMLEKKYAAFVRRFSKAKSTQQLAEMWEYAIARGETRGAFWALLTHAKCDSDLRKRTYEEVHMISHQIGAGQRADMQRLAEAETELSHLQKEFETLYSRTRAQIEERELRIQEMRETLSERDTELLQLKTKNEALQQQLETNTRRVSASNIIELEQQANRLEQAEGASQRWQQASEKAHETIASLEQHLNDKEAECLAMERVLQETLSTCDTCEGGNCSTCPDLQGQRVLCVGGRNQLLNHYRSLVDKCNGSFNHHDGGQEDSRARLEAMLSSADSVVCATDCVSHDAYYRLKRACKKQNKPLFYLTNSGISSFARTIEDVAQQAVFRE